MVSKVTVSIFVLCLLVSQSSQFPDHNRTRREDKPSLIAKPSFNIEDFQGFLTAVTTVMNNMNIPGTKGKPHKEEETREEKHEEKDKE